MIIVDNSIVAFAKHLNNGVHVPSYIGQSEDTALLFLIPFLAAISEIDDIPAELDKKLGLASLYNWYLKKTESKVTP